MATTGTFPKQIYFNAENKMEVSVIVDTTLGVTVGSKKIAKAGTPVYIDFKNRSTAVVAPTTDETSDLSNANGVLVHDYDVTNGDANGSACIFGFVNLDRLESSVITLLNADVTAALDGKVFFLKDN